MLMIGVNFKGDKREGDLSFGFFGDFFRFEGVF